MNEGHAAGEAERLRNRARLLEFLKFRVLASQEAFFEAWLPSEPVANPALGRLPGLDLTSFRGWLTPLWPAASHLSDQDLRLCLEQAGRLYVDPSGPSRR